MKKENKLKICDSEFKLMEVVWDMTPVKSMAVKRELEKRYGWSHSSVFTTLKRLSNKSFLKIENTIVIPLVSREEMQHFDSAFTVSSRFKGSLPKFISAFCDKNELSDKDIDEISKMLKEMKKK